MVPVEGVERLEVAQRRQPGCAARGSSTRARAIRGRPASRRSPSARTRALVSCWRRARSAGSGRSEAEPPELLKDVVWIFHRSPPGVRNDVAVRHVAAQGHVERHGLVGFAAQLLADDGDRAEVVGAASDDLGHRRGDGVVVVAAQQARQTGGEAAHVAAGLDPALEEDVDVGRDGPQPVPPLGLAGSALLRQQRLAVGRGLPRTAGDPSSERDARPPPRRSARAR